MHFTSTVLNPVFSVFGVTAELIDRNGKAFTVTAIDATKGLELTEGTIGVTTVLPVAKVRAAQLAEVGAVLSELDGGALRLNGQRWMIDHIREMPTSFGALDGSVWLILAAEAA